ncbi:MAG TPA: copper chaperone PCu(A)C [Vitreimonas sp.]|uniref:copper chaperone PCu(A)C n=1 Tax=Vitreimonas sp. TaxID=3069702 RepID=UPI002D659AC7|nr:copper chaperone PCu(A)C [Vitreimonas sp.]HYD88022.1 copper chaperone PCu(A)C [Vitreimonas sp.]
MRAFFIASLILLAACGAPSTAPASERAAEQAAAAQLEVRDAWAAPTPSGVEVAAGYLTIVNATANADRLVAISTPRAARAEAHEMSMDGGVMRMRAVEGGLAVPAGETVTLAPGGLHLMFFEVTQPFTDGESIPVTLRFERAGEIAVSMPVRRAAASTAEHTGH